MAAHPVNLTVPMQEAARLLGALSLTFPETAAALEVDRKTVIRWAQREDFQQLRTEWEQRRLDELDKDLSATMRATMALWRRMLEDNTGKLVKDGRIALIAPTISTWMAQAFAVTSVPESPPPAAASQSLVQHFAIVNAAANESAREG